MAILTTTLYWAMMFLLGSALVFVTYTVLAAIAIVIVMAIILHIKSKENDNGVQ
jgi:hypothetical protein